MDRTYPAILPTDERPQCAYVVVPVRFLQPFPPAIDARIPRSVPPRDAPGMPPSPNGWRSRRSPPVVESSQVGPRARGEPNTAAPQYALRGLDPAARLRSVELP